MEAEVQSSATAEANEAVPTSETSNQSGCDDPDGEDGGLTDVSVRSPVVGAVSRLSAAEEMSMYKETFYLLPRSDEYRGARTIKFFGNEINVLPPEVGGAAGLEKLQVKVPKPEVSGAVLKNLADLKELELSWAPVRLSSWSVLSDIAGMKCLTKLTISGFSLRFLPPEIGSLKKLQELDLSFNKFKYLPNCVAELANLRILRVSNNKLTDLPLGLSSLKFLESIDLSDNKLASISSLRLTSMSTLRYLNLQHNRIKDSCCIPSWVWCDLRGNLICLSSCAETRSVVARCAYCQLPSEGSVRNLCSCTEASSIKTKKTWIRHDSLQQIARQACLELSRSRKLGMEVELTVCMAEEGPCYAVDLSDEQRKLQLVDESAANVECRPCIVDDNFCSSGKDGEMISQGNLDKVEVHKEKSSTDDTSCITADPACLDNNRGIENELEDTGSSVCQSDRDQVIGDGVLGTSKFSLKSKRHFDCEDNPKRCKFHKPSNQGTNISYKYNMQSFCGAEDSLPDGFYDAGRHCRFMSIQEYDRALPPSSREVILLDREQDEELDAIVFSSQMLLSALKSPGDDETKVDKVDNLLRATLLALFVSNFFGGSCRVSSLMATRRAVVSLRKQLPFVCTCSVENVVDNAETHIFSGPPEVANIVKICERSIGMMQQWRNSKVLPLGQLQHGICRHRAVLLKYLCDRAEPPIPCELVRGYLDFMPHCWNVIPVKRGNSWVRMIVDPSSPTNAGEETYPEYFCRYMPLNRFNVPSQDKSCPVSAFSLPSVSLCHELKRTATSVIYFCKIGDIDAVAKVQQVDTRHTPDWKMTEFQLKHLGEVRMLDALRVHRCIVDIYGHQLSSKWVSPTHGGDEYQMLYSTIFMEFIKGGSLKGYLNDLSRAGEKYVPVDLAIHIAKEVASALALLHSRLVIHRDIKSDNILVDMDSKSSSGEPIVKLSDFGHSVPLNALAHSCCIRHHGIHPPDSCVGTPAWMAPEVIQAMHQKKPYGLEIDIWSYGCLLLELLTLQMPYGGISDAEVYNIIMSKQRPTLTQDMEQFRISDNPFTRMKLGIKSDDQADKLKLLINLFRQCTQFDPSGRPTAKSIHDSLSSDAIHLET